MKFKERYTNSSEREANKVQLTDDAYALGEILSELLAEIKQAKRLLIR